MVNAGELRKKITVQSRSTTRDEYGGETQEWFDFATDIRAKVEPLSGREMVAAQTQQGETVARFSIRYRPGVTQSMRIVYGGKDWNIASIQDPEERHRELIITASTGLNKG